MRKADVLEVSVWPVGIMWVSMWPVGVMGVSTWTIGVVGFNVAGWCDGGQYVDS